jgi:hypothetical protein
VIDLHARLKGKPINRDGPVKAHRAVQTKKMPFNKERHFFAKATEPSSPCSLH